MEKEALITGATGMIGGLVLDHCLKSQHISQVTSLVRRPSGVSHPKLQEVVVENFLILDGDADYFDNIDIAYYCLGVYTGAVDRELFRQITIGYPEALGRLLEKKNPELRFCLLSGAGADRNEKSRMMFARDKGIIENRLSAMGFEAFYAFRPGYIYPVTRRQEPNLSYRIMRSLYPLIKFLGRNSTIPSTELAGAMFRVGLEGHHTEILENRDILEVYRKAVTSAS